MDATSALEPSDPPAICALCHNIVPLSELESSGDIFEPEIRCTDCKLMILDTLNNSVPTDEDDFSYAAYRRYSDSYSDSDVDSRPDEFDEVEPYETTLQRRVELHRSLATNGRNRNLNLSIDWLNEIRSSERGGYVEDYLEESMKAAVSFVESLEQVVIDDDDDDEEGLECVICKESMCVGSVVNRLPCGHMYHPLCIVPWLNARNTCPLCRYEVPSDNKRVDEDEGNDECRGGRWWLVAAPIVCLVGIGVLLWLEGGGVYGSWADQRDTRFSSRLWSLL